MSKSVINEVARKLKANWGSIGPMANILRYYLMPEQLTASPISTSNRGTTKASDHKPTTTKRRK